MEEYPFKFFGQSILTTLTKHPDAVTAWIDGVKADGNSSVHRHVGFEVEFDNTTKQIGTVQFYVGKRCLVFQVVDTWICPPSLEKFLTDHNKFSFVGTNILSKMERLKKQIPFKGIVGCKDLGHYVPVLRDKKAGMLAHIVLCRSWARPSNLSLTQVHYASLDVFLNLHIAKVLWNLD